jgi:hypothetical protein
MPKIMPQRSLAPTNLVIPPEYAPRTERANITMRFVSETHAIIFDGYSTLYVIQLDQSVKTEDPLVKENWSILYKWTAKDTDKCYSSILKDAILHENKYHAMLANVLETKDGEKVKYETMVHWVEITSNSGSLNATRIRRINCYDTVPEYLAFETNGQSVFLAGPASSKFVYDSEKKIAQVKSANGLQKKRADEMGKAEPNAEKFYTWNQTTEEINLRIKLNTQEANVNKNDVKITIKFDSIEVLYKNENLLSGHLFSTIKPDESVWTLSTSDSASTIEVVLGKGKSEHVWTSFLKDNDKFGEYKSDEPMDTNFPNEFTSDTLNKAAESKALFSLEQQLEECDGIIDDQLMANIQNEEKYLMFRRLDGETHQETHKSFINDNKFLFEFRLSPNKCSALCLRHDVDGIVWQPHRVTSPAPPETVWLSHEYTFYAFGYVQASKQDSKYKSCPPDCSYVGIADSQKHVYVYKQDSNKVETQLRNRTTGKLVTNIAKQFLISLDSDKEIYGFYCANDFIIVLLVDSCHVFKVNASSK